MGSLIPRKAWEGDAIRRSDNGHAAWAKEVAKAEEVLFVDLYERIAKRYDVMGPELVDAMFADRGVHTSYAGAVLNAQCVAEGLQSLPENPLQPFFITAGTAETGDEQTPSVTAPNP